ncbi:MAG TPA: hypothetical protein VGQ36_28545 [Thermoanaerobaculia bacterium]|jgi:hypothetical protein|nr:hypothetical protein [Thermoanaerobaculia bacterium]
MIYRKRGVVARWENGTLIRVTESGVAMEEGEYFECRPESSSRRVVESSRVLEVARALRDLPTERLIVTHGVAEHECEGRTWRDETDRIHLSLVNGRLRALVDSTAGRLDDIFTIADALARAEQTERDAPTRLRLAANVTAALLPHLAGRAPSNVRVVQTAGGVDGYGHDIVNAADHWPNFYRPSYRVRPVRMPFNLRLECDQTEIDRDRPIAVALLAAIDDLALRVLVIDGARVYPTRVNVTAISAVAKEREWYPYGAGVFGAEVML